MRRLRCVRVLAAFAALAIGLGGCSGSRGTSPVPPTLPPVNPYAGTSGFQYATDFLRQSHFVKPATFGKLGIDVVVRLQNPDGLLQYAAGVRNPQSGLYRHFLTPEQIADRFFATSADYAAATKYLQKFGLKVAGWKQRFLLHVTGSQGQLERAFSTKFAWYQHRNETFLAPTVAPSVPKGVPIAGSPNIVYRTKRFLPSKVKATSNGLLSGYSPQQIQLAFDYAGAYNVGYTGAGITIGIIGTGPVSLTTSSHIGDLEAMRAIYGAQGSNTIALAPVTGTQNGVVFSQPPPVTKQCFQSSNPNLPPSESPTANCNPEDGEAQLDTEQTALLAPSAKVNYYLGYTADDGSGFTAQGLAVVDAEIQQALNDNLSDILSLSFGGDEQASGQNIIEENELVYAQAQTQGISVFASAGDNGAYACQDGLAPPQYFNDLCVSYPATDPNVTAVGGVNAPLNSAGQIIGPITAWGETTAGGIGGTGGGVSAFIPLPAYQAGLPGVMGSFRNVPDVSLDADLLTGVATVIDADPSIGPRQIAAFGGTSVAAPEMAAMWAIVLGVCKNKAGNCVRPPINSSIPYRTGVANPQLYSIYSGKATQSYALTFYDVLFGTTGQCKNATCPPGSTFMPGQNSGVGYDLTTGLGVPFARALVKGVSGL
jgi:subtilase family serine protease